MTLLFLLLRAAVAALEIWATNARYLLTRRISDDIIADNEKIAALRARGTPDDHTLADQLRDRVVAAQGIAIPQPLPAARPAAPSQPTSPDR